MQVSSKLFIVAVALCLLVGAAPARSGEPPSSGKHTPANAEVMASPQVQSAMHGAMQILRQMDGKDAKPKASQSKLRQNNPAPSDAMRDAMSVARQAFGYAFSHPNATDAELKAHADAVMSSIFSRELGGSTAPQTKPHTQSQSQKPVNGHGGNDGG